MILQKINQPFPAWVARGPEMVKDFQKKQSTQVVTHPKTTFIDSLYVQICRTLHEGIGIPHTQYTDVVAGFKKDDFDPTWTASIQADDEETFVLFETTIPQGAATFGVTRTAMIMPFTIKK